MALLTNLEEDGLIEISDFQLSLFAGVAFVRTYKKRHFTSSFEEGLTTDLPHLLFPFLNFEGDSPLQIEQGVTIQKRDSFKVQVGLLARTPIIQGISASIGVGASLQTIKDIRLYHAPEDFQLNITQEDSQRSSFQFGIHADFLTLLHLTLFRSEKKWEQIQRRSLHLSYSPEELETEREVVLALLDGQNVPAELFENNLIAGTVHLNYVEQFLVDFLLWSRRFKETTTQIERRTQEGVSSFFRHQFKTLRYQETPLAFVIGEAIKNLVGIFFQWPDYRSFSSSLLTMEYRTQDSNDILKNHGNFSLQEGNPINIRIQRNLFTKNKTSQDRNFIQRFIQQHLPFPLSEDLHGATNIQVSFHIGPRALTYFNILDPSEARMTIIEVCKNHRILFERCRESLRILLKKYYQETTLEEIPGQSVAQCRVNARRRPSLERMATFNNCLMELHQRSLEESSQIIPLWRLGTFLQKLVYHSKNPENLNRFFGEGNVEIEGSVRTQDPQNDPLFFQLGERVTPSS